MQGMSSSAIERVRVPLPAGFDPDRHAAGLVAQVGKKTGKDGWSLSSIDGDVAVMVRQSNVVQVSAAQDRNSFNVELPPSVTPSQGDKWAAKLAGDYADHNVVMTKFEPFNGRATLSRLDEDSMRCRGAVAVALGVKPWDVQVRKVKGGGFFLELPKTYQSSKHYDKLVEVATDVVGTVGWRVNVDTQALTAQLIPGDPPLFPKAVPYPIERLGAGDVMSTPLGVTLPLAGEGVGPEEVIDWTASAWALVAGTPGSGKALADDVLVPVPDGDGQVRYVQHGELQPGDQVFGAHGQPVTVTKVTPAQVRPVMSVRTDRSEIVADHDHLWAVRRKGKPVELDEAQRSRITELVPRLVELNAAMSVLDLSEMSGIHWRVLEQVARACRVPYSSGTGTYRFAADELLCAVRSAADGSHYVLYSTRELAEEVDKVGSVDLVPATSSTGEDVVTKVTSVSDVGQAQVRCIRVDAGDHLYLVGDMVPTHNTVALNSLIAQQVSDGAQLVICDDAAKAIDFFWAKPFVRDGGWGCDSEAHTVTALAMVYEEGQRRAKILAEKGISNWLNLPEGERFQPIFVVVDELSALTVMDPVPKGVPKDHPIVVEINQMNFLRALIQRHINKIIAEQRFVGIRMVLSTQVTNASTGLPPSLKNKIGHRVLAGPNPSRPARSQAFNDESSVVEVPEHVKSSGKHARGVGVADLEGRASVVYKSYYADDKDYAKKLTELGLPQTSQPSPTAMQVAKHAPNLEDDAQVDRSSAPRDDLPPSGKPLDPKFGPGPAQLDADGKPLRGAAAAAKALKNGGATNTGTKPDRDAAAVICPACDKPIDVNTGDCGCSW